MLPYIAEFLGTMMLIILGDGVVANVNLNKSGMKGAGAVQITLAWGLAVLVPAFIFGEASGASFNPALTIALAVDGSFAWSMVPGYVMLKSVDGLHSAHAYLVAHVLNLGCQGRDCLLNLSFSTIELSSEITECITIATDSIHKQGTTIVIVDFVSKTSAIATATKAETITAPTAEAKDKEQPNEPRTITIAESVITLHRKKNVWINASLLEQRSYQAHHSSIVT